MSDRLPSPIAFGASLGFTDNPLDRLSGRRDSPAEVARFRQVAGARSLVLAGDTVVLNVSGDPWFALTAAESLAEVWQSAFLGEAADGPHFATALAPEVAEALAAREDLQCIDLRSIAVQGMVNNDDLGALATAKALMHWHRQHRFCSNCGTPTNVAGAGWRRECPQCGTHHFPRTDPVVIMLAVRGDQCLLGRQSRFPPGMWSCLAGFVEPGETLEDAVRREIAEESGIRTGYVTYLGSQPWPFPASLMFGCLTEALSSAITVDTHELEDCRWFSRQEARALLEGTHPEGLKSPQPMAIANHILRAWVYAEPGTGQKS